MPANDYDLCNVALNRIGARTQITSLNTAVDTSPAAAQCALLYPFTRDSLLARFPWPFAEEQAALVVAAAPPPASVVPGWGYQYALPADYLAARYIFTGARPGSSAAAINALTGFMGVSTVSQLPALNGVAPAVPFEVANGYLFTDWMNAQLVYTALVTSPLAMPMHFQEALIMRLAAELAMSEASKPELSNQLLQKAEMAFAHAAAVEMNIREPDMRPDSSYIAGRG